MSLFPSPTTVLNQFLVSVNGHNEGYRLWDYVKFLFFNVLTAVGPICSAVAVVGLDINFTQCQN